jgi:hypothetical protein
MNQVLEMQTEPTDEQVAFADRIYEERDEMAKKAADLILYLSPDRFQRGEIEECMRQYFAGVSIIPRHDDRAMWFELSKRGNPIVRQLGYLARILLNVPISEASCERVISLLEYLFDSHRASSGQDLVQAELRIRGNQVFGNRF